MPTETVYDRDTGKSKERKIFPGYVIVKMIVTNESWYLVRNTRGVTGFVGPESKLAGADAKPIPLSDEEMVNLGMHSMDIEIGFEEGDAVKVLNEVWKNNVGIVRSINHDKQVVTIGFEVLGKETPVEFSFAEISSIRRI